MHLLVVRPNVGPALCAVCQIWSETMLALPTGFGDGRNSRVLRTDEGSPSHFLWPGSGAVEHRHTATTTMVKRTQTKWAPRQAGSKASDRATNPFGDDDIDKFHKSKDKLALNPEQDSDSGEDILGSEDEGVLDIEDPSDDELDSDDDVEDGDLEEGDKKLAACEFILTANSSNQRDMVLLQLCCTLYTNNPRSNWAVRRTGCSAPEKHCMG